MKDFIEFYKNQYINERRESNVWKEKINRFCKFFELIEQYKLHNTIELKNEINTAIIEIFTQFKYCVGDSLTGDIKMEFHNKCDKNKVSIKLKNIKRELIFLNVRLGNKYIEASFNYKTCRIYEQMKDYIKSIHKLNKELQFLDKFFDIFNEEKTKVCYIVDINVRRLYRMYNVSNLIKRVVNSLPGIISYKIIYKSRESKNEFEIRKQKYYEDQCRGDILKMLDDIKGNIDTIDKRYLTSLNFYLKHFDNNKKNTPWVCGGFNNV
jgi:hypothetical protein